MNYTMRVNDLEIDNKVLLLVAVNEVLKVNDMNTWNTLENAYTSRVSDLNDTLDSDLINKIMELDFKNKTLHENMHILKNDVIKLEKSYDSLSNVALQDDEIEVIKRLIQDKWLLNEEVVYYIEFALEYGYELILKLMRC